MITAHPLHLAGTDLPGISGVGKPPRLQRCGIPVPASGDCAGQHPRAGRLRRSPWIRDDGVRMEARRAAGWRKPGRDLVSDGISGPPAVRLPC